MASDLLIKKAKNMHLIKINGESHEEITREND
jgi:hypothetical protein